MTKRRLLFVAFTLAIVIPFVVYAAVERSTRLDRFLALREAALNMLHKNAASLPAGVEHRTPHDDHNLMWQLSQRDHIESVVGGGKLWFQDGYASYELTLGDDVADLPVGDVAMMLTAHFAMGLPALGLRSPQSGGPGGLYGGKRATHAQWWRDPKGQLIVAFSVVVDRDSRAAHVHRFVHERFE